MITHPTRRIKNKQAQTLVEYAIILALISVVAIAVMISMAGNVKGTYTKIDSSLSSGQANH